MNFSDKAAVSIAGMIYNLQGSLPMLDEFVCCPDKKGGGQICCVHKVIFDGTEKLAAEHKEIAVYAKKDGTWIYASTVCKEKVQVSLSADCKTLCVYIENPDEHFFQQILRNLLRTAFECVMAHNSRVSLHSACIDVNGEAVAFTGVSGMGKSTRASAWIDANGAEFVSGDRPALHISANGVTAYGVPWDGKERIFRQADRPLKAILDVRRSDSVYIRRLSPEQAQKVLVKQVFIPMWDTNTAVTVLMNIRKLAKTVPVYRLFCGPDEHSARQAFDILFNNSQKIAEEKKEMRIKDGFVLRNIADEYIVMPTGDNIAEFDGAIALNEVSALIFEKLGNPMSKEDLVTALLDEYDVDARTAEKDVDALIARFDSMGIIE